MKTADDIVSYDEENGMDYDEDHTDYYSHGCTGFYCNHDWNYCACSYGCVHGDTANCSFDSSRFQVPVVHFEMEGHQNDGMDRLT